MALTKHKLGDLIELVDERNFDNLFGADSVVGLGTQKEIISTKADLDGVSLTSYKLFPPKSFAYVPDTSRRGDKISLAHNTKKKFFWSRLYRLSSKLVAKIFCCQLFCSCILIVRSLIATLGFIHGARRVKVFHGRRCAKLKSICRRCPEKIRRGL